MYMVEATGNMAPPSEQTERVDQDSSSLPGIGSVHDEVQAAAGATGVKTATSSEVGTGTAELIALAPEPGTELASGSAALDGKKCLLFGWGS